jgi:hypothetical protein
MRLADSLKSLSHHAYCIIGGNTAHEELLIVLEKKHKLIKQANSDFYDASHTNFTIDDARNLKTEAEKRPVSIGSPTDGVHKIFVIKTDNITGEAQNALLKLFEEPPSYARFFIIVPHVLILLPTVRSRMSIIHALETGSSEDIAQAKLFVGMSIPKRLEFVKELVDDIVEEKRSRHDAISFIDNVISYLYSDTSNHRSVQTIIAEMPALESALFARGYADDRSASIKMLLEYIALRI